MLEISGIGVLTAYLERRHKAFLWRHAQMVRIAPVALASLALIRDRIRLGMAIAAIMAIIDTTIMSSMSVKPAVLFMAFLPAFESVRVMPRKLHDSYRRLRDRC